MLLSVCVLPLFVLKLFFVLLLPSLELLQPLYVFLQLYSPLIATFLPTEGLKVLILISDALFQLLHQPIVRLVQTQSLPFPAILFLPWLVILLHALQRLLVIAPIVFAAFQLLFFRVQSSIKLHLVHS